MTEEQLSKVISDQTVNALSQANFGEQDEERKTISHTHKPNTGDLDLNMIGSQGFNCLHAACGSGNIEMTRYLLQKRNVNPNTLGKDGWSPLEIAVQTGIIEIVQLILQDKRIDLQT